jgi:hypothetical protein
VSLGFDDGKAKVVMAAMADGVGHAPQDVCRDAVPIQDTYETAHA